jgi:hypothetical protein
MNYKNKIYGDDFKEKFENGGFIQHVDLPRLDAGMQGGAFWSAFMPCPAGNGTDFSTERYAPSKSSFPFSSLFPSRRSKISKLQGGSQIIT